jgi:hypothetical protein
MKDKKPCLTFPISNSPFITKEGQDHAYCEHPVLYQATLGKDIKKRGLHANSSNLERLAWQELKEEFDEDEDSPLEITAYLPYSPELYFVKYFGGNDLEIYQTKKITDSSQLYSYLDRCEITVFSIVGPEESLDETIAKFGYGSLVKGDPWSYFETFAWLEDICGALSFMGEKIDQKDIEDIDESWDIPTFRQYPDESCDFLKCVGNKIEILRNPDVLDMFITMHKIATHSSDPKEARAIRTLFLEHFIPKSQKLNSDNLKVAKELMVKLAKHYKWRCEKLLGKKIQGENQNSRKLNNKIYKDLKTSAQKNNEPRIAALSLDDLSSLLFSTNSYITSLLEKGFGVSSKTLSRSK